MASVIKSTNEQLQDIISGLEKLQHQKDADHHWEHTLQYLQDELHKIDEQYREGRIEVDGKVPKGQAELSEMLEQAHDLARELVERSATHHKG